jgi:HEAT repeat protein
VAQLGTPDVAGSLIRLLSDTDSAVRREAATALATFPGEDTTTALCHTLQDDSPEVVEEAVHSLGKLRAPAAREIVPFLRHAREEIRLAAAKALGEIGDTSVAATLRPLTVDVRSAVARAAEKALQQLTVEWLAAA